MAGKKGMRSWDGMHRGLLRVVCPFCAERQLATSMGTGKIKHDWWWRFGGIHVDWSSGKNLFRCRKCNKYWSLEFFLAYLLRAFLRFRKIKIKQACCADMVNEMAAFFAANSYSGPQPSRIETTPNADLMLATFPLNQVEITALKTYNLPLTIYHLRSAAGLTIPQLAKSMGISKSQMYLIETSVRDIRGWELRRLAMAMNVSADDILGIGGRLKAWSAQGTENREQLQREVKSKIRSK